MIALHWLEDTVRRLLCRVGLHSTVECRSVMGRRCWACGKLWPLTK